MSESEERGRFGGTEPNEYLIGVWGWQRAATDDEGRTGEVFLVNSQGGNSGRLAK